MRRDWLGLAFTLVLVFALAGFGCGDDDDDNDNGDDDDGAQDASDELTAIMEEIVAGQMARTAEALEKKVFVHISEVYDHAGFDKEALMEDRLEELVDSPELRFDDYELEVAVELADDRQTARVAATNAFTATIVADDEDDFDITITGSSDGVTLFALEDGDTWRVVGAEAVFNTWDGEGGAADLAATGLQATTVSVEQIGPDGTVSVQGSINLPSVEEGGELWLNVLVEWGDDRNNAEQWPWQEEIVSRVDVTEFAGTTYDLDVEMPGDGDSTGHAIPAALPLGVDAVNLGVQVIAIDAEGKLLRADVRNFSLPFAPPANAEACQPGPNSTLDGLWSGTATGNYGTYMIDEQPVFDLAVVGNDVYGVVGYVSEMYGDEFAPVLLPVTGTVAGSDVLFGFADEDFEMRFEATLEGTSLTDGVMMMSADGFYVDLEFSADKLDDRCDGVDWSDLDGAALAIDAPGLDEALILASGDEEWTLSGVGVEYEAYPARNLLVALDADSWLVLAFFNDDEGWASVSADDGPATGAFIVQ